MFDNLTDNLTKSLKRLAPKKELSEEDIAKTLKEVKVSLLEADVALPVVKTFIASVKARALSEELAQALDPAQHLVKIVDEELTSLLGGEARYIRFKETGPTVIMLTGLQGVGKTTFAGKLALWLKEEDLTILLVAADLHRPNAVAQLKVNGEKVGAEVFAPAAGNGEGDPVEVARLGLEKAEQEQFDVVIVDTAGRLGIDTKMMEQAREIKAAINPDEVLFVIDAMMGQNATATALAFREALEFDGIVLTKLDGDARGGSALSLRASTNTPIMFASTGEKMTELELFHPSRMAGRILDMGDMLTLIEQAEKKFDLKEMAEATQRARAGEFTLDDFIRQLEQMSKLGSLARIAGFLPGMKEVKAQLAELDPKEVERKKALIYSMTLAERQDYEIIDLSRATRIAKGAGGTVEDLKDLLERFQYAQHVMKTMLKESPERKRPRPPR